MTNDCQFCLEALGADDPIEYPADVQELISMVEERVEGVGPHA